MINTKVTLAGVELKNPVMTASGTFGSGAEYSEFVDLNKLGGVVTKGVANVPWPGNPTPRVTETASGMLNAIGLQNPGIDLFCKRDIPFLKQYDTKIIVNVCGKSTEDYCEVVERLADEPVDLLEINVSCPNVKEGGIAFGQDPHALEAITKEVKKYAKQPIIMKLSPNVTDITEMAKAAEAGGADACGEKVTAQETAPEAPEAAPAPAEEPEPEKEITFSKKVITERDIIEANRDGVKVIRITERNILTALAKDAASARNIRLVRE